MSAVLWNGSHAAVPPPYVQLSEIPSKPRSTPLPPKEALSPKPAATAGVADAAAVVPPCQPSGSCPFPPSDDRSERDRLIDAMETAGWVQAKAARILGLTPRQIGYALRKHDVPIKRF